MTKILIVEDNTESRYLLEQLLASRGHQILAAENGREALELAAREIPDVIISDIMMPIMNGFKLCSEVKKDPGLCNIPFVFYTATFVEDSDEKLAMSLGASRFLIKPADEDAFLQTLDDVLEEHRQGGLPVPEGPLEDEEVLLEMYDTALARKLAETVEKLQDERSALIQSEQRLKEAQQLAHVGHWELDLETGSLDWSDELYRILGEKPRAFDPSHKTLLTLEVIHPDDKDAVTNAHKEALAKRTPCDIEYRLLLKDGTVKYVNEKFQTIYDEEGVPTCSVGTVQDITERKEAEETLRINEERYRLLIENAGEVVLVAQDGNLKFVNQRVTDLLGRAPEEVIDKPFLDYIHPEDRKMVAERHTRRLKGDELVGKYSFRVVDKAGETRWVEINAVLIQWEGRPATLNFLADINDRKQAEEERDKFQGQLVQAQKMESVGRLAGGVAHDFNNMLSIIRGNADLALLDTSPEHPVYKKLREIQKAANRSTNIIRQLLAFARKQVVSPRVLYLNDTLEGMLKMLRRLIGEDIDLIWKPDTNLWLVNVDPSQIDQILANLCVNARDAISGVGDIVIETQNVTLYEADSVEHGGVIPGEYVILAVTDDGCGMDREILENIFEPFFTTKEVGKGTGLGLSTVYGIVKQNEGFVNAYSEPGKGTTIRIYLPRHRGEVDKKPKPEETKLPRGSGETILIVEDDPSVLDLSKQILEHLGYDVLAAERPLDALDMVREQNRHIHLLLTDLVMPKMNGKELAQKIQKIRPGIKVLFMSGYTATSVTAHRHLPKGVQFIDKPLVVETVARKVREVLDMA